MDREKDWPLWSTAVVPSAAFLVYLAVSAESNTASRSSVIGIAIGTTLAISIMGAAIALLAAGFRASRISAKGFVAGTAIVCSALIVSAVFDSLRKPKEIAAAVAQAEVPIQATVPATPPVVSPPTDRSQQWDVAWKMFVSQECAFNPPSANFALLQQYVNLVEHDAPNMSDATLLAEAAGQARRDRAFKPVPGCK